MQKFEVAMEKPQKVSMVLTFWRHLATATLDEEKCEVLQYFSQQLIGQLHELVVMTSSSCKDLDSHVTLTVDILETQTHLLCQGPVSSTRVV